MFKTKYFEIQKLPYHSKMIKIKLWKEQKPLRMLPWNSVCRKKQKMAFISKINIRPLRCSRLKFWGMFWNVWGPNAPASLKQLCPRPHSCRRSLPRVSMQWETNVGALMSHKQADFTMQSTSSKEYTAAITSSAYMSPQRP